MFKTPQAETIRQAIHHWARTITDSRQNQVRAAEPLDRLPVYWTGVHMAVLAFPFVAAICSGPTTPP